MCVAQCFGHTAEDDKHFISGCCHGHELHKEA